MKNGSNVTVNTTNEIWSCGLAVAGSDVFVFGVEVVNGINVIKYWKNGIASTVTDGTFDAEAWAFTLSGSIAYIAGWEKNNSGIYVAKYWVNGSPVVLSDGIKDAGCIGIFVK